MKTGRRNGYHFAIGAAAVLLTGSYVALNGRSSIASETPAASFTSSATFGVPRATGNGKHSITMLSPAQVSSWIRENEESYLVERGKGVVRYDVSQLASNNPIEDDRSERTVQVPILTGSDERVSSDWMFWGVYDGHSGWTTSTRLRESLITSVLNELDKVYARSSPNSSYRLVPSPETIDSAIQQGFLTLDDEIVNKSIDKLLRNPSKAGATELIAPALSGSCALLAFYDSNSKDLRVAVAGDSRAVLGSRNESGNWTARALTTDQTGSNEEEAARVRAEHPGEEATAIRHGRVLGSLEPTRSFGDARYKWTRDIQNRVSHSFFGRRTPQELKTPPYVTAKPVVTTTKVSPEKGDFMVIGSDGLFELLSNEEVVNLVAQWMRSKQPDMFAARAPPSQPGVWSKLFGSRRDPNAIAVEDVSTNKDAMKQPIRRRAGAVPQFTVEDENCATHLIRNALGGADQEQVSMLVSIPSPLARNYRDDLTVTVVFFGDGVDPNDNGPVKVNQAATRNNLRTKSKL